MFCHDTYFSFYRLCRMGLLVNLSCRCQDSKSTTALYPRTLRKVKVRIKRTATHVVQKNQDKGRKRLHAMFISQYSHRRYSGIYPSVPPIYSYLAGTVPDQDAFHKSFAMTIYTLTILMISVMFLTKMLSTKTWP